jgi:hypothetical protein
VLLLVSSMLAVASDRTLFEEASPTIIFRGIAVSGERFDQQCVIGRSRKFLAANNSKKLIVLTLVPDEPDANISLMGCDHCKPYPFWRMQYDAVSKRMFAIGELMAFGQNSVVRFRDKSGSVSETVLTGSDPRSVVIGGFKGKIVHAGMSGRMPMPWLELYVVGTGALDSKAGAEYVADFSRQMGVNDSTIEFRSDPWFINEIWRTWLPLFEEHRGSPPSEEAFAATKTLDCFVVLTVQGKVTNECSWHGSETLP